MWHKRETKDKADGGDIQVSGWTEYLGIGVKDRNEKPTFSLKGNVICISLCSERFFILVHVCYLTLHALVFGLGDSRNREAA